MMTTEARVRELSGFDNTTNVTSATVRGKIAIGESMVNSAVGSRYSLPVKFRRSNTVTFSGTGSGSGSLTVTVNGVAYVVAVTLGLTAERAAELFRIAAKDSAHFAVRLNGAEATLISKTLTDGVTDIETADDEVSITSSGATAGVTQTAGTRNDRYTPILTELASEIAAALLLKDNFGIEAQDTPKDGDKRLAAVRDQLELIQGSGKVKMNIYDEVTGLELESGSGDIPAFHPDDTSFSSETNPTAPKLSINSQF